MPERPELNNLNTLLLDCRVINRRALRLRKDHISQLLAHHRIEFSFSEGVEASSHAKACALAHQKALRAVSGLPALVLEDDVAGLSEVLRLPPLPRDADIIYLGVSPFGCFPWRRKYVRKFRHCAFHGMVLATKENENWLRLHSMAGAIAILYVSERGADTWKRAMETALRRNAPFDVFTAYAMTSLNVYAPHMPLFCEAPELQGKLKHVTPEQRSSWTTHPIEPIRQGAIRRVPYRGGVIMVEAVAGENGGLEWAQVEDRDD